MNDDPRNGRDAGWQRPTGWRAWNSAPCRIAGVAAAGFACTPTPDPATSPDPIETTPAVCLPAAPVAAPAPPPGPADVLTAACTPDPTNVLRATCHLTLSAPAIAEVSITDGTETAVFTTDAPVQDADLAVWGLTPSSTWQWTARAGGTQEVAGALTTGPLPERIDLDPGFSATGPSTLVQWIGPIDCAGGGFVGVLDALGRVRWYQDSGGVELDMVEFTNRGTVLLEADASLIVEFDASGQTVLRYDDLPFPLHHDVTRHNDCVYVLSAEAWPAVDGVSYIEDMVVALGPDGTEVWRWETHGRLDPTRSGAVSNARWDFAFPDSLDAWHTNGLAVTESSDVVLSLYRPSTVLSVSGTTGEIVWAVGGDDADGTIPVDFAPIDGAGPAAFGEQHHPALLADGSLTVFDNRNARGLALALDADAGTATFVDEWVLPQPAACPVQGSVFPLGGGQALVNCPDDQRVVVFDAEGQPIGTYDLSCRNGGAVSRVTRSQPIDLWGGVSAAGVTVRRE